jgi:hypothetical protein
LPRSRAIDATITRQATLEAGLKLDLNSLLRRGFIKADKSGIRWTDTYEDEERASGIITADMSIRKMDSFESRLAVSFNTLC